VKTGVALAMAAYLVPNQVLQWWNMVTACQEFGGNPSNAINCLWGAVTTVITAAGTMYGAYTGIGRIQTWMNNNGISIGGFKRDEVDQELLDALSGIFGGDVTHLGVWDYTHLGLNGTLSTREATTPLDVFGFTSQFGANMHFSYLGNTTNGFGFKFGWGSGTTNTKVKGRAESFDQQYFSSGGIDFIINQNQEDGGKLDSYSDYWWIYDQVACLMSPGMTAAGHWFQLYDNVQEGTMAEGAVAPFRGSDHWSAISIMNNEPTPLLTNSACEKRKERSLEFKA
jgi:hypothetical protein